MLSTFQNNNIKFNNNVISNSNSKKWIKIKYIDEQIKIPHIVITTSSFHKNRTELIFQGIFYDYNIIPQ